MAASEELLMGPHEWKAVVFIWSSVEMFDLCRYSFLYGLTISCNEKVHINDGHCMFQTQKGFFLGPSSSQKVIQSARSSQNSPCLTDFMKLFLSCWSSSAWAKWKSIFHCITYKYIHNESYLKINQWRCIYIYIHIYICVYIYIYVRAHIIDV